jgi:hypothetical protein
MATDHDSKPRPGRLWLVTLPFAFAVFAVVGLILPVETAIRMWVFEGCAVASIWCRWTARTLALVRAPSATAKDQRRHLLGFFLIQLGFVTALLGWTAYGVYCRVPAGTQTYFSLWEDRYGPNQFPMWPGPGRPSSVASFQGGEVVPSDSLMRVGEANAYGYLAVRQPFTFTARLVIEKQVQLLEHHPFVPLPREAAFVFGAIAVLSLYAGSRIYLESLGSLRRSATAAPEGT